MRNYHWPERFMEIYNRAAENYRAGNNKVGSFIGEDDKAFLATIGCKPQELFDLVEDFVRWGEPSRESALLITAVRREYFLVIQKGIPSGHTIDMASLPAKDAELAGVRWLPRIIEKARAKLRGEMPDELMYGCGGDRPFLKKINIEPSEFLRLVWSAQNDDQRILDYVLEARKGSVHQNAV